MPPIADSNLYGVCADRTGDRFMIPAIAPPMRSGGGLDVPVADVRVAQRHLHLGVAEQTRHHRQRNTLHRRLAGKCVSEIVKAHILDTGQLPHPLPQAEIDARPRRIHR